MTPEKMSNEERHVVWCRLSNCNICGREFNHGDTYVLVDKKNKIRECHKCYLASQYTNKGPTT